MNKEEIKKLKSTKAGLRQKNILQWTDHCDRLEARAKAEKRKLSEVEKSDIQFRRLQVERWQAES